MKQVVIDTNVLVSATLSPQGNSAQIITKVSYDELRLIYSQEILDEYSRVLAYDRLNISQTTQDKVIEGIIHELPDFDRTKLTLPIKKVAIKNGDKIGDKCPQCRNKCRIKRPRCRIKWHR